MTLREIFNGIKNLFNYSLNNILDFDLTPIFILLVGGFMLAFTGHMTMGMIDSFKEKKWNIYQKIGLLICYLIVVCTFALAIILFLVD